MKIVRMQEENLPSLKRQSRKEDPDGIRTELKCLNDRVALFVRQGKYLHLVP
jgi:hypothetical protein